jgi:hypothetical protein
MDCKNRGTTHCCPMKGWRYKLQLFQQGFCGLSGQTLFLDLDVVIVDNLDPLFDYVPQSFSIIQDLQAGEQFNSSVFFLSQVVKHMSDSNLHSNLRM